MVKLLSWLRLGLPKKLLNLYKPCLYFFTQKPRCLVLHKTQFFKLFNWRYRRVQLLTGICFKKKNFYNRSISYQNISATNKWKYRRKRVLTHITLCLFVYKDGILYFVKVIQFPNPKKKKGLLSPGLGLYWTKIVRPAYPDLDLMNLEIVCHSRCDATKSELRDRSQESCPLNLMFSSLHLDWSACSSLGAKACWSLFGAGSAYRVNNGSILNEQNMNWWTVLHYD